MNLFFDLYQQFRIAEAQATATTAKDKSDRLSTDAQNLRRQIDALTLMNQAVWELLREQFGLSDSTLAAKMEEIDLRDGVLDGRMSAVSRMATCPDCGRRSHQNRPRCLYCGAVMSTASRQKPSVPNEEDE